ncbi:MAG: hypothetical protein F6K42_33090 [Leptolyngbya sp. SIO1D8]|nr:hypothetical protein [Leptolyngbya sp. SIO1D8]
MILLMATLAAVFPLNPVTVALEKTCDPAYAEVCIPPPPPDLDCGDVLVRNFRVYLPNDSDIPTGLTDFDPHHFDGDEDGIGCEQQR